MRSASTLANGVEGHDSSPSAPQVILSFDIEEHDRIEAAAALAVDSSMRLYYRGRLGPSTRWLLDRLHENGIRATFFLVGEIVQHSPGLIRDIHAAGHELASHGWDHRRIHEMTPATLAEDLRKSKDALEQVSGAAVVGYRAPTFSVTRRTAWAIDVLAEMGFLYDSSIYPVRHDRYGVPGAPRAPFLVRGPRRQILEIPPATLRVLRANLPAGGGGYFRLFPLALIRRAIDQTCRECRPAVATLYFHNWEFDPAQDRLPLGFLSRFRTYVGIERSQERFRAMLASYRFVRCVDVASRLVREREVLPRYHLTESAR